MGHKVVTIVIRDPDIAHTPFDDPQANPVPLRHPGLCLALVLLTIVVAAASCVMSGMR